MVIHNIIFSTWGEHLHALEEKIDFFGGGGNKIFEWHFKHLMLIDMEDISISMNSSLTARKTIYNHIHTLTLFLYNGAKRIYSDS